MRSRYAVAVLLVLVLLVAGFSRTGASFNLPEGIPSGIVSAVTGRQPTPTAVVPTPTAVPASTPTSSPATPATATATPAPATAQNASTTTDASAAIQAVIQKADQEQQDAFAKNDPTIMKDTATSGYYSQITQINDQMAAAGITSIKLLGIEWGSITMNSSTTATATDYETWQTVFNDGTTQVSRDLNVYTLVLRNGAWLIQSDVQPNSQGGSGQTTTPGQTTVPGVPTSPSSSTLPTSLNQSHNWSGYAATGGTFTSVTGTWTVPTIPANGSRGVGATWVGIGGTSSRDLIQAGTQEVTNGQGRVSYSAWTELLPAASENVPLTINPGDSITVTISQQSAGQWLIDMKNNTTGKTYSTTVQYNSSESSAEWIVEAPSSGRSLLPLDNFGSIPFTNATTTENGKTVTLSQANATPISMIDSAGNVLATPSAITANGKGFTVTRTNVPASTISVGSGRGRRGF